MPRFTLKDLFLATTLIALGFIGLCAWVRPQMKAHPSLLTVALLFGSAAVVGAGIGTLFHRKISCASWACVGAVLWLLLLPA